MIILDGKSICDGIAIGKLFFYKRAEQEIPQYKVHNVKQEINRFEQAKECVSLELQELYCKVLHKIGKANAMIFEIHRMIVNDVVYCDSVIRMITSENINAEYAVNETSNVFAEMLSSMDDAYMQARAADVVDVSERLIKALCNVTTLGINLQEPVIIAADDLVPSETIQLDKNKVLGVVTICGSATSHTAILMRTLNIPAVAGAGNALKAEFHGCNVILDGSAGKLYIDPDDLIYQKLKEKQRLENEKKLLLQNLKGKENVTLDGQKINISANVNGLSDIDAVLENDADSIGLFRSEYLYLESTAYPTEEQQFQIYKTAVQKMNGKKVVIRTLDIGTDKKADYFNLPMEENPALGYRAIRICLTQQKIFETQLRAIYRASAYGNLAIVFPMIISLQEVQKIKKIVSQVKQDLKIQGIAYSDTVPLGIMIETPAAALISDILAQEVDFFSIGTNDLIQYTLAADRKNPYVEGFYNAHHPAVLRLIKTVTDNAHKHGIRVGICGEIAADKSFTGIFLDMGVDELSVAPSFILKLRKHIRELKLSDLKEH